MACAILNTTFIGMKKQVLFLFASIIVVILVLYAFYIFPIPGTDSVVYIPAALLYAKGQGLANPLYYITRVTDLTHTNRFNYYVPFQAQLLGWLSQWWPGVRTIFLLCSFFSISSLLLYTRHIGRLLTPDRPVLLSVVIYLSVSYMGMYLLPTSGRPETLTAFMAMLLYFLWQRREKYPAYVTDIAVIVLCGLMLATQILSCYFSFLVFVTFDLLESKQVGKTILRNTVRFLAILMLAAVAIAWSPNGFMATMQGIAAHASFVMGRNDRSLSLFLYYWVLYPFNFAFLALFALALFFYIRILVSRLRSLPVLHIAIISIVQIVIFGAFVKFVLCASPAVYNVTQFVLPISAFVLGQLIALRKRAIASGIAILTFFAGTLIFGRSVVLFADYLADGKTYEAARKKVRQIAEQYPGVHISMGLWCLFDNPNDVKIFEPSLVKKGDVIIVEQANHPFPSIIHGKTTTLFDWSTKERRTFLGVPITNRPQGYSFILCRVTEEIERNPEQHKKW